MILELAKRDFDMKLVFKKSSIGKSSLGTLPLFNFPTWPWQKKHKKEKPMYRVAKYSLEYADWLMMKCVENWNGWTLHRHVSFWHNPFKREPLPTTCIVMEVRCWEFQCSTLSYCFNGWEFMGNVWHFYDTRVSCQTNLSFKYFFNTGKALIIFKNNDILLFLLVKWCVKLQ